ncbi:hypothetical protein CC80DRAFT_513381 [Byssothecium circinans]|uniref:DUF7924 domain-containing protein n=1 Tax=Byssothecium circinans TaxID=147558 RepID=A0A6A5U5V0_9PLEO|nr:hypothetical protein CC80DRAFT_513381 [Byssothecium circinans]
MDAPYELVVNTNACLDLLKVDTKHYTASVRHPSYRQNNLNSNGLDVQHARTQLPAHISSHLDGLQEDRGSPGLPSDQIDGFLDKLETLAEGCTEADVQGLLEDVSGLHPQNAWFAEATTQGLRFPFFAIEFKAAGGSRGDLWVATNQCAGASSACLNAVDRLNTLLQKTGSEQRVDNLSYSIAVDNSTAQLYISWKEANLNYYLQRVDAFLLSCPEHFREFRKQVRNILDWGKDTRLPQIKDALDIILDENRKKLASTWREDKREVL